MLPVHIGGNPVLFSRVSNKVGWKQRVYVHSDSVFVLGEENARVQKMQ